jgi:hypothetical protein
MAAMLGGARLPLPGPALAAALAASALLISLPVVILPVPGRIPSALYARIAISHYFYGGLVLLAILAAVRSRVAERHGREPSSVASAAASR